MSEFKIEVGRTYAIYKGGVYIQSLLSEPFGEWKYIGIVTYRDRSMFLDHFTDEGTARFFKMNDICEESKVEFEVGFEYECENSEKHYLVICDASKFDKNMDKPIIVSNTYTGNVYFVDKNGQCKKYGIRLIPSSGRRKDDKRLNAPDINQADALAFLFVERSQE